MITPAELRIEPSAEILAVTRRWLEPVSTALGAEWIASYLTGSVLAPHFDPKHSSVNLLVVLRSLDGSRLQALASAIPRTKKPPHFDPLFFTRPQIEKSLDVFPIEWLEIQERHFLIDGENVLAGLEVPVTYLRLQCEHELRGKHLKLRHAYLASAHDPEAPRHALTRLASSFATLFRTLLRLRGETPPADAVRVIERVAELHGLDAHALLAAHRVRYPVRRYSRDEIRSLLLAFMLEVDRLVTAIDELRVP